VYFGFSGDVHAAPDLRRLEGFLKASFAELRDAVRLGRKKASQAKKVAVKTRTTSTTAPSEVRVALPPRGTSPMGETAQTQPAAIADEKVMRQLVA
jgi:hypothetical protein